MSRTFRRDERHIRARGIRNDPPDLRRLARALIELVEAQAEADAEAQIPRSTRPSGKKPGKASRAGRKDAT